MAEWWETIGQGGQDWFEQTQEPKQQTSNQGSSGSWWQKLTGAYQDYTERMNQRFDQGVQKNMDWLSNAGLKMAENQVNQNFQQPGGSVLQQGQTQMEADWYHNLVNQQSPVGNQWNVGVSAATVPQNQSGTYWGQQSEQGEYGEGGNYRLAQQVTGEYSDDWVGFWNRARDEGIKAKLPDGSINPEWVAIQRAANYEVMMNPSVSLYPNQGNDPYDYPYYQQVNPPTQEVGNDYSNGYGGWGGWQPKYYGGGYTSKKTANWVNLLSWRL